MQEASEILWTGPRNNTLAEAEEFVITSFWNWKPVQGLKKRRETWSYLEDSKTRQAVLFSIIWSSSTKVFNWKSGREGSYNSPDAKEQMNR